MARVEYEAEEARQKVESYRIRLFGRQYPPFRDATEAAEWIESQRDEPTTQRLVLTVDVPVRQGSIESIAWLRDRISHFLEQDPSVDDGGSSEYRQLLACEWLTEISHPRTTLPYFGINAQVDWGIKRVLVHDGTQLGQLASVAERLAEELGWHPIAAVHHLLTGGLVAQPSVEVRPKFRLVKEPFHERRTLEVYIHNPDSVTEKDLVTAFKQNKSSPLSPELPRRRGRSSVRTEKVAAWVIQTPAMSWEQRLLEWNRRNPDDRNRSVAAIKKAYSRSQKR